jgi:hypothetical protein
MSAATRLNVEKVEGRSSRRKKMNEFVFLSRGGQAGRSPEQAQQMMQ